MESDTSTAAEVACAGNLWAKSALTGERVTIDSWYGEVHVLVNEDGVWRLRGRLHPVF